MTPAGEQAYQILQRAFDDHSYIGQAKADLAAIATSTQQERNEAGDAATMLSRLASSLQPAGRNISDQVTGGTGDQ